MSTTAKRLTFLAISLIVVFLLIYPRLGFLKGDGKKPGSAPGNTPAESRSVRGPGGPVTVDAIVLKSSLLNNKVLSTGTVIANEAVDIRSEISGKITGIFFNEGDNVKKGQLLLRVNDDELQAQLRRIEYNIELNQTQESRQKKLLDKEAISQQEYDVVLTGLNSIQAELQLLRAQIAKFAIRAPFDGIIGLRYVSAGSYISPSTLMASLQDIDPVKVEFSVSERYGDQVKKGDNITFTINGTTQDERYAGKVYAVEPKIDLATRSVRVRALCPNPDRKLIPGAFARVELSLGQIDDALMVPTEALVPTVKGQTIFLYRNGLARSLPVQTGIRTERSIQITKGAQPNDSLIVTGLLQLKDSTQVKVNVLGNKLVTDSVLSGE
ncbi:MAG: efflux RND transporter periplasmic adaptor subunit [Ferruginibacter sp.]|nr:efflux RND transporter periplasmic adaptor subunit [Cytophagales bacterium]